MDGANVARALERFEAILNGEVADEVGSCGGTLMEDHMKALDDTRLAIVVVGASRGIGRAIAKVAARDGAPIVLVARSLDDLAAAASEIREAGGEAFTLELDLFSADASVRLAGFLSANKLSCDVLVNSAGYGLRGGATTLPIPEQLGIIDLNIRPLTDLSLHFLPAMVARGRGGVLNLGSIAGFMPGPGMALYYASKSYVRSFSFALHQELRRTGVTVLPRVDADYVAERAWRGFKAGRRLVIPGISAKLAAFAAAWLPSAIMLPLI
eukprot:gene23700-23741_t